MNVGDLLKIVNGKLLIPESDLDLTRLESYASDYFGDSNPQLYRKYFPGVYDGIITG